MAKQVEDIVVRLVGEGFEALDKIKGSFRDLGKVTNLAEKDILSARDSLSEFAKAAGNTEAVNKGLIDAFKGLRSQVDVNSAAYRSFSTDIARLETELRGSTAAIDRQRTSLLSNAAAGKENVASLQRQVNALRQLQQETRPGSSAFLQLGKDIDTVTIKLGKLKSEAQAFNLALGQQAGATPEVLNRQIATLQKGLQSVRFDAEQFVETLRKIQLLQITQTGRTGRAGVIADFEAYRSREFTGGFAEPSRLAAMPDTTAALNQELGELTKRLDNVSRGGTDYVAVSLRIADIQRQLRTELVGTTEAFRQLDIAQTGADRRAGKLADIQEYYRTQGPTAPGVGGFRDPQTGAMIAAGSRLQTDIRPGTQYDQPIGPQPVNPAFAVFESNIKQSQDRITSIYDDAYVRRTQLQADYNQISIDKLLTGLDMEGQVRNAAFGRELADFDKQLEARDRRRGRRLTGSQLAQGAGAALSGGIFGGPEGLIGGLGGLAVGGVGGAFAGAAAGAQVGMFRQQLAGTADYAASIGKLQIALRGVVGSQAAYDEAIRSAAAATRDLNIPQEEATRGLTRLSAAVIGAGGTVADSSFAFRAMSEAIKATGGNAEQVDGALLALTQVFSKGKVSAEELNQIAERLPGTFTLFAQAAGKTGPELQKALEQGQVGLNDLMKFLELTGDRYGKIALDISGSSQDAGARLTVAFQAMRLEVGNALQPLGAELQGAFATFISEITPAVVGSAKAIAAVLSFLTTNDLVAFGVQLTAVSLGFKGLQVAAAALTSLNIASWFTATAVGAKVTSSGMAAATVTTGGLTGALKALTLAMAKNPITLLILAGTAAAIKIGSVVLEQKKLNDEVQRSLDIAAKAPASGVATEINATENELRAVREKYADVFNNPGFDASRFTAEAAVDRLEAKLRKLNKTYKARVELETIFSGLDPRAGVPTGYKLVNGRLAYLSPGQGYVDAETGKPVAAGRTKNFPGGGGEDAGEKAGASLLQAIEQREEALLNLRTQREEQLAQIREQAVEQAKQIETQLADRRLAIERQIQDITRQRSDSAEDSARRIREARGEDSDLIAAEQKVVDIFREERDSRIDSERRLADDKKQQEETIANFQKGVAKSINDANRAHTQRMGEIQKQYATSVAKIIDEGTGKAGKRLAAAAQLAALYIQRGVLNNQIGGATGLVIPERASGKYDFAKVGSAGVGSAQDIRNAPRFQDVKVPLDTLLKLDETIESLRKGLSTLRAPGIGQQFTALLGAEGGYEDVAGLKPLPVQRMQQQAARPFLELWKTWESFTNNVFGPSKQEVQRVTKPDPARNKQVLERIQRTQTAIDNYDPVEAKWKEIDNKLREVKRSKPATMSATALVSAVESIYTDLSSTVRKAGGLAVKAGERLGSMLDFSEYASPQQSQVIGKGVRDVLSRAYERSVMLGGDKNAFSDAIDQLAPLTRKFGGLIQEVLQIEARKGYAYAEKALPRFRLAPTPAARPEDRQDMMDRLDRMYEQPYITPGIQNRIEGASLPGTSFDVSRLGKTFGEVASASFIGGLLAQNSGAPRATPESQILRDAQGRPLNGSQPTAYPIPVIPSAAATTQLRNDQAAQEGLNRQATTAEKIKEAFADVNREGAQFTNGLNDQLQLLEDQRKYLDMGFSDALSRDLANLDKGLLDSEAILRRITDQLKVQGVDAVEAEAAYDREKASLGEVYALNVKITQELEKQTKALAIRQDDRIGLGMQEGVTSYLESIGTMRKATEELTVNGIKGVENAIFDLVTTGKTNFREFAADILRQTARMIIQQLVLRNVLLIVKSAFGFADGGAFGGGAADPLAAGGAFWNAKGNAFTGKGVAAYAMGGGFAANNIIPYAKGGTFTNSIVSKPTLFKFAAGGTMQTGVMGEAGPEAIMPLSRGANGKLGVASSGSGGTTNVTVNVDASGTKTQGDSSKSEQLGRAVSQAVQDELLRQKRPGGLLA